MLDRLQIGTRIGFGQRETAANLAGREFRQPFGFLLERSEALDRRRHDQMRIEDAGDRHPIGGDQRHDLRIGRRRQAEAAIFLDRSLRRTGPFRPFAGPAASGQISPWSCSITTGTHFAVDPFLNRIEQSLFFGRIHRRSAGIGCGCHQVLSPYASISAMAALPDEHGPFVMADDIAMLILANGLERHNALFGTALALAFFEHFALAIKRVAGRTTAWSSGSRPTRDWRSPCRWCPKRSFRSSARW